MRRSVDLSKQATVNKHGKRYVYWVIRWYDAAGKRRSRHLGRADQLSRRHAENLRRHKEAELRSSPARRNISRAPTIASFLEFYFAARATELAPGSLELHCQTGRYLQAFFGPDRRLDEIMRHDARAFKTALAAGDLMRANKRKVTPGPVTVDLHIRNARTIFNRAVADDLLEYCPFDRLGSTPLVSRDWHYVSPEEFTKLMEAARSPVWRLLLGLGRWAALRRGEALNLRWRNIDWANNRLRVISQDDWDVKDKDARIVPICPELHQLLLAAFDQAAEGEERVIPVGGISIKNFSRDFGFLCKRAGVDRYAKPLHTLRKSCITDWAQHFPAHVVKQWAGHSDLDTTDRYYLQVSEAEYERAAARRMSQSTTQLPTQLAEKQANSAEPKNGEHCQPSTTQELPRTQADDMSDQDVKLMQLGVVADVWSVQPEGLSRSLQRIGRQLSWPE
jgi:integrase